MANTTNSVWLKVLIGAILAGMGIMVTVGFAGMSKLEEKKVDKNVFEQHEKYQTEQYSEIKESLIRIEGKM